MFLMTTRLGEIKKLFTNINIICVFNIFSGNRSSIISNLPIKLFTFEVTDLLCYLYCVSFMINYVYCYLNMQNKKKILKTKSG